MNLADRQLLFLSVAALIGGGAIARAAVESMDDLKSGAYHRSKQPKMTKNQAILASLACGALVYKMISDYEEKGLSAVLVGE